MQVRLARCIQFWNPPVRQLVQELKALSISGTESTATNPVEPKEPAESEALKQPTETVDLVYDHVAELLCFTTEVSLDPGLPKMLKEAMASRDADKWREAIANKIMNFLKWKV